MGANISRQVAQMSSFSRQQLQDHWLELYGRAAPPRMHRSLRVPFLAHRVQENAYAGLNPSGCAELRRIARALEEGLDSATRVVCSEMKCGTPIVRQLQGKMHKVLVTDPGFEAGGANHGIRSQIAWKITSRRVSGPVFFGLAPFF
jgi:DUF2924 family protein